MNELRDKKILFPEEYRKLLKTLGPCTLERVAPKKGGGPDMIKLITRDKYTSYHYLAEDLLMASNSTLIEAMPKNGYLAAPDLKAIEGKTFNIIEGKPLTLLEDSEEVTITGKLNNATDVTKINFEAIATSDAGNYSITAENDYGTSTASFSIVVWGKTTISNVSTENSASVTGNAITYSGEVKCYTEADGLETWPAGTFITGNRIGVCLTPNKELAQSNTGGTITYGSNFKTTADCFATSPEYPEEEPNFKWWPAIESTDQASMYMVIDWFNNNDINTMESFEIKFNSITLGTSE